MSMCIHCGMELSASIGHGLFTHANNLQRCQAPDVPYGHMGHPEMPCPAGDINPCLGYDEARHGAPCRHVHENQQIRDGGE